MKRLKVNTSFEEDADERRAFFASLSYSERLRYYFKLRNTIKIQPEPFPKGRIFKVSYSHKTD